MGGKGNRQRIRGRNSSGKNQSNGRRLTRGRGEMHYGICHRGEDKGYSILDSGGPTRGPLAAVLTA
jgi:hypothetical protein